MFILTIGSPITFGYNIKILDIERTPFSINSPPMDSLWSIENHEIYDSSRTTDLKTIIWDNGGPSEYGVLILSQFDEVFPFNAQVADDFIFEDSNMEVFGIRWWGNFWGVGEPIDPIDFNIYFYADDGTGNAPTGGGMDNPESTALASYFMQGVSGVNDSGQRFYSVGLPIPFIAMQGEKYWLVIQAVFESLPKWGRVTNEGIDYLSSSKFGCPLLGNPFWMDPGFGDVAWYLTGGINEQPDTPVIDGPINGKIGVEYEYNFSIFDPEGDMMYIRIDWGDGVPGKWDGPFSSGSVINYTHSWSKVGTYIIKAQAKDIYDYESDWGALTVTIPRTRPFIYKFKLLTLFLDRLSISNRILNLLKMY